MAVGVPFQHILFESGLPVDHGIAPYVISLANVVAINELKGDIRDQVQDSCTWYYKTLVVPGVEVVPARQRWSLCIYQLQPQVLTTSQTHSLVVRHMIRSVKHRS